MMKEYQLIKELYGDSIATRTGQSMIRHIDQGLILLEHLGADSDTLGAWCVHPIFQLDELFSDLFQNGNFTLDLSHKVIVLAMEYRHTANAYLSSTLHKPMKLISPLKEVNQMLIADKVQNRRDAWKYFFHKYPERKDELDNYFKTWLDALGVTRENEWELWDILKRAETEQK